MALSGGINGRASDRMSAILTNKEAQIVIKAIAMLECWDWSRGEPLAALSLAAQELYGDACHAEIARLNKAERDYAPAGAISNNVESRLASLGAVLRFGA